MTPESVADVMVALVGDETVQVSSGSAAAAVVGSRLSSGDAREGTREVRVVGGMVLEVAKGRVRVVEQFNDVGPSGEGNTVGNAGVAAEEIFERLRGGGSGGE